MCADLSLPLLGKVPLDPRIAQSCDEGRSFLSEVPDSPAAKVYQTIVQSESVFSIYLWFITLCCEFQYLRKFDADTAIFHFLVKPLYNFFRTLFSLPRS